MVLAENQEGLRIMKTEIDYKEILDSYGIKYRKGTPEEVDASIKNMDKIFHSMFGEPIDISKE